MTQWVTGRCLRRLGSLAVAIAATAAAAAAAESYRLVEGWGALPAGQQWGENRFVWPHGFRIDKEGNLWITDGRTADGRGHDTIYVADVQDKQGITYGSAKDGVVRGTISGTLPESMALGADGSLYAGETTTGRVLRKFVKH